MIPSSILSVSSIHLRHRLLPLPTPPSSTLPSTDNYYTTDPSLLPLITCPLSRAMPSSVRPRTVTMATSACISSSTATFSVSPFPAAWYNAVYRRRSSRSSRPPSPPASSRISRAPPRRHMQCRPPLPHPSHPLPTLIALKSFSYSPAAVAACTAVHPLDVAAVSDSPLLLSLRGLGGGKVEAGAEEEGEDWGGRRSGIGP